MYKNNEGYPDPTSGEALGNIARQERAEKRAAIKQEKKYLPKIYVCSPFAGDTEGNIVKARRYCAFAVEQRYIPYASHLFFPQFMSDDDPAQRELGLFMGMVYLDGCKGAGCSAIRSQAGWLLRLNGLRSAASSFGISLRSARR